MIKKPTVMLAVDDGQSLRVIEELLEGDGYSVVASVSSDGVFELLETKTPDLILLDIEINGGGRHVIDELRGSVKFKGVPVIFIASGEDADGISRCIELGAADFVTKPVNRVEILARVRKLLNHKSHSDMLSRLNDDISRANKKLLEANRTVVMKNQEMKELIDELDHATKTDFLTGLSNRPCILGGIEAEIERSRAVGSTFAVLLGDLDRFKSVNDSFGHDCGDEVLKNVAGILASAARQGDSVARWGGEEFLFLIPDITEKNAVSFGERIRAEVERSEIYYDGKLVKITITIGVTMLRYGDRNAADVIKRADGALYAGKNSGRNKVVLM